MAHRPVRTLATVRLAVVAAATVALGGCAASWGMPDAVTEQGESVRDLWSPAVVVALVVGGLVWTLIIWSVVAYRRRSDELPSQVDEHIPIEVVYTVVPVLIVICLFIAGTITYREVNASSERPDQVVTVTGFQWSWQFAYEGTDVVVEGDGSDDLGPELVLPVDRTTRLDLVSEDVAHSFWVPRFLTKRDLIPGLDNAIEVTPTETGTYAGRCAEFCGLDHWRMSFQVRVVDGDEFDRWLARLEAEA